MASDIIHVCFLNEYSCRRALVHLWFLRRSENLFYFILPLKELMGHSSFSFDFMFRYYFRKYSGLTIFLIHSIFYMIRLMTTLHLIESFHCWIFDVFASLRPNVPFGFGNRCLFHVYCVLMCSPSLLSNCCSCCHCFIPFIPFEYCKWNSWLFGSIICSKSICGMATQLEINYIRSVLFQMIKMKYSIFIIFFPKS